MSLSNKINEIISKNEEVYWNNEFQIQLHMSKKYLLAFKAAAIIESGEFDETFPPPTHIVADLGADKIDNHNIISECYSNPYTLSILEELPISVKIEKVVFIPDSP